MIVIALRINITIHWIYQRFRKTY